MNVGRQGFVQSIADILTLICMIMLATRINREIIAEEKKKAATIATAR